jgi:hypothetical protein
MSFPQTTYPTTYGDRPVRNRPLVSNTSILILSAFIIGMVSGRSVDPTFQAYMYAAGAAGLLAYFSLERLARFRRQRAVRRAYEQAANNLERRIDRHIQRGDMHALRRRRAFPVSQHEEQYLTVTSAGRPWVY